MTYPLGLYLITRVDSLLYAHMVIGKVVLDETRGILHDTTLNIGPLRILAVPGV